MIWQKKQFKFGTYMSLSESTFSNAVKWLHWTSRLKIKQDLILSKASESFQLFLLKNSNGLKSKFKHEQLQGPITPLFKGEVLLYHQPPVIPV